MLRADWQYDGVFEPSTSLWCRVADGFSALSLTVATISLAAVPWFLGGAIPPALLVLQCGAVCAAILAMAAMFLARRFPTRLPHTSLPVLGFAVIGLLQLLPVYVNPALEMHHAVNAGLAKDLPATQSEGAARRGNLRSVMPAETRLWISQALSLSLLAFAVFETATSNRRILWAVSGLVISGCGMTTVALSQKFGAVEAVIGNQWKVSPTTPFGCFVNPNNAAGWLMVCLAGSVFLCGVAFRNDKTPMMRSSRRWSAPLDRAWMAWYGVLGRLASINTLQLMAAASGVLLTAGIAATLSRAGIIAAIIGLTTFAVSRYRSGRLFSALAGVGFVACLACLFLILFQLDTVVLSELRTLKDPVSESTGRLLHWSDSLRSCLDFPVLGSGLGGYRYGSLPYQRHYTSKWFQRADNQYVEVLVETGIAGLICFVGFGIMALLMVRRVLSDNRKLLRSADGSITSLLGSSVLFCVVSLAAAAFFDYGIAQPSVSGAIVVLVALLERRAFDLKRSEVTDKASTSESRVISAGPCLVLWFAVTVSAAILLPDTLSASRVFAALVPLRRMVEKPNVTALSESGDEALIAAESVLKLRPDDFDGLRVRARFLELLFRNEFIRSMSKDQELSPAAHENVFRELNPFGLAHRLLNPKAADVMKSETRTVIDAVLKKYPWSEADRDLLKLTPCVLEVATDLGMLELMMSPSTGLPIRAVIHSQFAEPNNARTLSQFGQAMLMAGRADECRQLWQQSLAASELFRPDILVNAVDAWGSEQALREFAPQSYESTVSAAIGIRSQPALRASLFEQAEQLWSSTRPRLSESVVLARAMHFEVIGQPEKAIEWLAECLADRPKNLPVRKMRARLLEQIGRNRDAYDEWLRVQNFDSSDAAAPPALEQLLKEPPTDIPR